MNAKEELNSKISEIIKENADLKKKIKEFKYDNMADDDKLKDKVPPEVSEKEAMEDEKSEAVEDEDKKSEAVEEDEVTKEKEAMEDEEPTQMEKLVRVVETLSEKVDLMEARFKEQESDEDEKSEAVEDEKSEAVEDEKSEAVEDEEPKKEELNDQNTGVDAAGDNGMVTTKGVDPKDNPEEPEAGADKNKDGNKDKIIKNEGVDEEDSEKSEAVEDEDKKSEATEDEESEKEPQAPVVEGINKLKIGEKFEKKGLKESMKKLKLMR